MNSPFGAWSADPAQTTLQPPAADTAQFPLSAIPAQVAATRESDQSPAGGGPHGHDAAAGPRIGRPVARVNLLPLDVREGRRLRRTQQLLAVGLGTVLIACAGTYVLELHQRDEHAAQAARAQQQANGLTAQARRYQAVTTTADELETTRTALAAAMADDVAWAQYLDALSRTTPPTVSLTSLSLSVGSGGSTDADGGAAASDPLTPAGIGTLSASAEGTSHLDTAAWLDALNGIRGITGASFAGSQVVEGDASGSSSSSSSTTFSSTAVLTDQVLSHRYDARTD